MQVIGVALHVAIVPKPMRPETALPDRFPDEESCGYGAQPPKIRGMAMTKSTRGQTKRALPPLADPQGKGVSITAERKRPPGAVYTVVRVWK